MSDFPGMPGRKPVDLGDVAQRLEKLEKAFNRVRGQLLISNVAANWLFSAREVERGDDAQVLRARFVEYAEELLATKNASGEFEVGARAALDDWRPVSQDKNSDAGGPQPTD